jgi:hypothetical protein
MHTELVTELHQDMGSPGSSDASIPSPSTTKEQISARSLLPSLSVPGLFSSRAKMKVPETGKSQYIDSTSDVFISKPLVSAHVGEQQSKSRVTYVSAQLVSFTSRVQSQSQQHPFGVWQQAREQSGISTSTNEHQAVETSLQIVSVISSSMQRPLLVPEGTASECQHASASSLPSDDPAVSTEEQLHDKEKQSGPAELEQLHISNQEIPVHGNSEAQLIWQTAPGSMQPTVLLQHFAESHPPPSPLSAIVPASPLSAIVPASPLSAIVSNTGPRVPVYNIEKRSGPKGMQVAPRIISEAPVAPLSSPSLPPSYKQSMYNTQTPRDQRGLSRTNSGQSKSSFTIFHV